MRAQHPLRRATRALLRTPSLWVDPAVAAGLSLLVLGAAVLSQRELVLRLGEQMVSSELSAQLVQQLDALRRALPLYIAVLVPIALVLLLVWLIALARLTDRLRRTAAPDLPLPRQRGHLLPPLLWLGGALLVAKAIVLLAPLPLPAGQSLLLRGVLALVVLLVVSTALPIIVVLRPRPAALLRTVLVVLRAQWGSALGLLAADVVAILGFACLLGYPLGLAVVTHQFGAALILTSLVVLVGLAGLALHVVAWDLLTFAALGALPPPALPARTRRPTVTHVE